MPVAVVGEHITAMDIAPGHGREDVHLPKLSEQHRFHLLDAVRGVAAALVVLYHAHGHLDQILYPESFLAVDLFFCLSGFVVCASYEGRLAQKMSMKSFVMTRIIRLYPVYLLGMVILLLDLLSEHLHHPQGVSTATPMAIIFGVLLIPLFSSGTAQIFPLNGPAWSLFFEIIANIFYALLVRMRIARSAFFIAICVVSFGVLASAVHSTAKDFDVGWSSVSFLLGFARVAYSFFAGVLLFRLYRFGFRLDLSAGLSAITSVAVVILVILCLTHPVRPEMRWTYDGWVIAAVFPGLVFVGACCKVSGSWIKICSFFGDFSYPLYILHIPIMFILFFARAHFRIVSRPGAIAFETLIVLVPITWWIGKYVDAPARRHLAARLRSTSSS